MNFRLLLHETPPSLNSFGSVGGGTHHRYRRVKKQWQGNLGKALMVAGVPRGLTEVLATAVLRFERKVRRDEGNFRFLLEKALGDALVEGGWLADDTGDSYSFGRLRFDPATGPALTVIELEVGDGAVDEAAPAISQPESGDQNRPGSAQRPQRTQRTWKRGVKG